MIREVIRPKTQSYTIEIPPEYLDREIEIIVFPVEPEKQYEARTSEIVRKTSGILAGKAIDPVSWQKRIRGEWDSRLLNT